MAFGHGKNARFLIDNSTGGLTDISTGMTDVDFPQTADTAEVTGFSDSNKAYVLGTKGATITVTGAFSTTVDNVLAFIVGGTTNASETFNYYPNTTASNAVIKTGECFCVGYNTKSGIGGAVNYTATFTVTGAVTSTTV